MGRAAVLPYNYPHLQNLIKRDASAYATEFYQQYQHFKASLAIVQMRPAAADEHFEALVTFISHVAHCYAESKQEFPQMILTLLGQEVAGLNPSLRKALVQALLLLRKHKLIELVVLLELFFRLLKLSDKALRELLYVSIVGEVRRANRPHKNNALNKTLQNFIYALLEEVAIERVGSEENSAVDRILHIVIELYRKRVWEDTRTVNVIAEAAMKKISVKVISTALNFFIGRFRGKALIPAEGENSDGEASGTDEEEEYKGMLRKSQHSGANKRSTRKKLHKALSTLHRKERRQGQSDQNGSFAAIHLLNDPHGFVERLFGHLRKSTDPFEVKLLMMNVISRVIGAHKLLLLDFYSFILRYIQPHQKEVTHILAFAAQATHDELPSDVIAPLLTAIAHNFAAEHCGNEVIAAGLNGIREISSRCPGAMSAELLQDLSNFKGYHDKGVVMATRSLIALYREVDPEMLNKKDRGKVISIAMKNGTFKKNTMTRDVYHLDASQIKSVPDCNETLDGGVADCLLENEGIPLEVSEGTGEQQDEEEEEDDDEGEDCLEFSDNDGDDVEDEDDEDDENDENDEDDKEGEDEDGGEKDEDVDQIDCALNERVKASSKDRGLLPVKAKNSSSNNDILRIAATRMLTPAEFTRLRKRIAGDMTLENSEAESDCEESSSDDDETGAPEIVDPRTLESTKKSKQDYASRMASIQAGREGRLKFGSRKGKHIEKASSSNRIKEKRNKNAIMLAHKSSVRAKRKRSLKERQQTQNKHKKKQRMRK